MHFSKELSFKLGEAEIRPVGVEIKGLGDKNDERDGTTSNDIRSTNNSQETAGQMLSLTGSRYKNIRYRKSIYRRGNTKRSEVTCLDHVQDEQKTLLPCDATGPGVSKNKHVRKSSRNGKLEEWVRTHERAKGIIKIEGERKTLEAKKSDENDHIYKWLNGLREDDSNYRPNKFTKIIDQFHYVISPSDNRIWLTLTHNNLFSVHNVLFLFPMYTTPFESLTHLDISHNRLSWIPARIGQLVSLRYLNLSYNLIEELPCQIAIKMSGLQQLDVSNNPLAKQTGTENRLELSYSTNSAVPKLSELCYREYLNRRKEFLNSKYVTKRKYLTEAVRSTLLQPNKRVCSTCDCLHTEYAATLLHFTWVCLVPDVPLRIAGIPVFLVIYTVLPSAIFTARHRSRKGNWYIPPEPTDESPSMQAKLLLLNSLAVLFTIKYIAQYIFGHPNPEIFVTGALLTVVLITVVIYHFENIGVVKPAIPLSVLWGTTTLTTLYYTTSTHDITHEIYLISSLLMFMLEWASPRSSTTQTSSNPVYVPVNDEAEEILENYYVPGKYLHFLRKNRRMLKKEAREESHFGKEPVQRISARKARAPNPVNTKEEILHINGEEIKTSTVTQNSSQLNLSRRLNRAIIKCNDRVPHAFLGSTFMRITNILVSPNLKVARIWWKPEGQKGISKVQSRASLFVLNVFGCKIHNDISLDSRPPKIIFTREDSQLDDINNILDQIENDFKKREDMRLKQESSDNFFLENEGSK
ncbi:14866_t:CDS:2 [Acaulospora colombiana]|uniref:14866_t:CDS:1 n=1 Tax=Acaulospora colombiana TaxID=27376 RepID=A0ACA9L445_9GLOM|nr:14866_t:CDS:2 [Acaulospora colombiana]